MIAVRNLVKTIRNGAHEVEIIRDISFDVPTRQFVAVMGPSGSGKSTLLGLIARRDHYPVQLSGGEQQRVALARAFMMKPAVLLADEPTGNLDTANGRHVLELLIHLNKEEGTTLLLVTHDDTLASHAERKIVLKDGRIAEDR